jgi:hypothetical protein
MLRPQNVTNINLQNKYIERKPVQILNIIVTSTLEHSRIKIKLIIINASAEVSMATHWNSSRREFRKYYHDFRVLDLQTVYG